MDLPLGTGGTERSDARAQPVDRVIHLSRSVAREPETLIALAQECYPDLAVAINVDGASDVWRLHLSSRAHQAAIFDPDLAATLSRMGMSFHDVMPWRRMRRVGSALWMESFNNSWALAAWSRWLAEGGQGRPLLIRVDAHDDLGVPPLLWNNDHKALLPLFEEYHIDLRKVPTVDWAVEHGMVGIGSFVMPFLLMSPADIIHVQRAELAEAQVNPIQFAVKVLPWPPDPKLGHLAIRNGTAGCTYLQVAGPTGLAELPPLTGRSILLDIDLDYFALLPARQRPGSHFSGLASVESLFEALRPVASQIRVATIAYSPGFCPSRLWSTLVKELGDELGRLLSAPQ
jgi:hypothetical protein